MKPFARGVITPALLDMLATTASSATMLYIATFGVSHTGSPPFGLPLQHGFSCSLKEPEQSSCRLYAVRCVTIIRCFVTLNLSGTLPPRFYHSKGYFRHLDNGSLALTSSVHTIQSLDLQMPDFAFTLTLSPTP